MNFVDRWAAERLKRRGYTPVPSTAFGGIGGGGGGEDDSPAAYLDYARISNIVYACTRLRADAIASLPLRFYALTPQATDGRGGRRSASGRAAPTGRTLDLTDPRIRRQHALPLGARVRRAGARVVDLGEAVEVEAGAVVDVLSRPAPTMTWRELVYLTEFSMCLAGRARWLIEGRDAVGAKPVPPTGLRYVRHDRLEPVRWRQAGDGLITGWTLDPNTAARRDLPADGVMEMRFPDPADPDYGALPPLAAARLGADSYAAAMKSNAAIFKNGIRTPGMIGPPNAEDFFTDDQLTGLASALDKNARGEANSHRLLAVPYKFSYTPMTMSPKDAEFTALLDFSVEDVGRAFGIPLEMIGGNRATYRNREQAALDFWATCGSEAAFIAEALTEMVLPLFGADSGVDFVAFDMSGVSALQEDETAAWTRAEAQIGAGAITANEWRETQGKEPLQTAGSTIEVGKIAAIFSGLQMMGQGLITAESLIATISGAIGLPLNIAEAIVGDGPPVIVPPTEPAPADETPTPMADGAAAADAPPAAAAVPLSPPVTRTVPEFGSAEHLALWTRAIEPTAKHEAAVKGVVVTLFEAHRDSILDRLGNADRAAGERGARIALDDLPALFGRAKWLRQYRESMRKALRQPFEAGGAPVAGAFDAAALTPDAPEAVRFLMGRAQRFATSVNDTTWTALRSQLADGIANGAGLPDLRKIVGEVMDGRIRSSAEVIARTEVLGAYAGGSQLTAEAIEADTGLTLTKTWITALDERVRPDHAAAHGQTVKLADDFEVGGSRGPCPGQMGAAEQDIQCRCVATYDEDGGGRGMTRPVVAVAEA